MLNGAGCKAGEKRRHRIQIRLRLFIRTYTGIALRDEQMLGKCRQYSLDTSG